MAVEYTDNQDSIEILIFHKFETKNLVRGINREMEGPFPDTKRETYCPGEEKQEETKASLRPGVK